MNANVNNNYHLEYDENLLNKIKEIIKKGLSKLKSFIKLETEYKFKLYEELNNKFNEIANELEKYDSLSSEFNYFISISGKILYIIHKNCEDNSFGHYDYVLELFSFYNEILDAKIDLLNNSDLKKYEKQQKRFENIFWEYKHEFYLNIHTSNGDFSETEIYKIHEKLRD